MASADELFERAGDAILVLDPSSGRVHDANATACELFGYARGELVRAPISRICPRAAGDLSGWIAIAARNGHARSGLFACRKKSGRFVPTEIEAIAPDARGYVFVLVQDRSGSRR